MIVPAPESTAPITVALVCPRCAYRWQAATILPGQWWSRGVSAETIARICYCPKCETPPPMWVVKDPSK